MIFINIIIKFNIKIQFYLKQNINKIVISIILFELNNIHDKINIIIKLFDKK